MHLLLADTTAFAPVSPMFSDALDDWCRQHPDWTWSLADEHATWRWNSYLIEQVKDRRPDVVLVMMGTNIQLSTLQAIKQTGAYTVCYATDDPWNEINCHQNIRDCIPLYDMYLTCKRANVNDLYDAGAKEVHYLPVAYKPSIHFSEAPANEEEAEKFRSDICVIGGADAERLATVKTILKAFPKNEIALWGGYWDRDPDTAPCYRGFAYGKGFRLCIGGAKIVLNLLRKANRDQHSMKSFEVYACGGVMLTDDTSEHRDLGCPGVYFSSIDSLLQQIELLLQDQTMRESFRVQGQRWIVPHTYQNRLNELMKFVECHRAV